MEDEANDTSLFGIDKESAEFCFGCRCRDEFQNGANNMDGAIEADWHAVIRYPTEEEMAADTATGLGCVEVRGVAMDI